MKPANWKEEYRIHWVPSRPDLTIRVIGSSTPFNCYHETLYEVVSRYELNEEAFAHLSAARLLGGGQAYHIESHTTVTDSVPPTVVDRKGVTVDIAPYNEYSKTIMTKTHDYEFNVYVVKRICDSGD